MRLDDVYKLALLYRQSRDGNNVAKFKELCHGKGATVAVGKVSGTEEILGGYNPVSWTGRSGYISTDKSFIFALDKNIDKNIVSFVNNNSHAVFDYSLSFPGFGSGNDLYFGNEKYNPRAQKGSYQVAIRSSSDAFEWADWEVFSVSKS